MSHAHPPKLKKFMDKKVLLILNGDRRVQGILWAFDPFMSLVMDERGEVQLAGYRTISGWC